MRAWLRAVGTAVVVVGAATQALAVEVGDEAPALDIKEWMAGDPLKLADGKGKNVVVLAFFTSFDKASKRIVPQLNKLQEKHRAAGLVVIGISDQRTKKLREFVAETDLKYRIAADNRRNSTGTYMAKRGGVPYAFVVSKDGIVAWHGNPASGLEGVVKKLLSGSFDLERAKKGIDARKALADALKERDDGKIGKAAEELLEVEPADLFALGLATRSFKRRKKRDEYMEFVSRYMKNIQDEAQALNAVAWDLATSNQLDWRDIALALRAAKRAVEVSEGDDAAILDTYARVLFELGKTDRAVEYQKKAVGKAPDDNERKSLQKTLDYYESCVKAAKDA